MKFVLVVAFFVICAGITECYAEDHQALIHEASEKCKAKEGVNDEDIVKLLHGDFDDGGADKNLMCFTKCMLEEFDGLEDDVLKEDVFMKHLTPHLGEERAKEIFELCKDETGEGECETPFVILTCLRKSDDIFKF